MRKTELRFGPDQLLATAFCLTSIILRLLVPMNLLFYGKYDDALMLNTSQVLGSLPRDWTMLSLSPQLLRLPIKLGLVIVTTGTSAITFAGVLD